MTSLLEARGVCKRFPGVQALDGVNLSVAGGEILAVVGENGAGKSTLMKILGGVCTADAGQILVDGQPVRIASVKDAEHLGIALIHQELNLAEHLDVAGNIFLGREPTRFGWLRLVDRAIYPRAQTITRRLGLDVSPRTLVGHLSVGQQQLVEIARALSLKSRLLILDEPTSSLTERETVRLFEVLRNLRGEGLGVVYISHRLKEVNDIADRVTVLRDGKNAGELTRHQPEAQARSSPALRVGEVSHDAEPALALRVGEISHDAIVRLMVGRNLQQFFHRERRVGVPPSGGPVPPEGGTPTLLEVDHLRWSPRQQEGVSLSLRPGEIVGLAGLIGAGRTELAETLFGIRPRLSGAVRLRGKPLSIRRPAQAIAAGIFLVPEDRRFQGLILTDSIKSNISLPNLGLVQKLKLVLPGPERKLAQSMCARLHVRMAGIDQAVGLLSGGNQQKVVLAKWLCRTPTVLILDEPTRGVDVGAKSEIYALMDDLARHGLAVLMISSDLEEILGMSDRVLVLHQGRLAGELPREKLSEQSVMHLATGGRTEQSAD